MVANLFGALRVAAKRMAADWLIVTAAFLTIALASVLLASGPIYAEAVTISALRQTLDDASVGDSNLSVEIDVFPNAHPIADEVVRSTISESLEVTGADVFGYAEADAYGIERDSGDGIADLAVFQHIDAIEANATLIDGSWPDDSSSPLPAAISTATAGALGLSIGDTLDVVNRRDDSITATVSIVGIFEAVDASDPFWFDDPRITLGYTESPGLRKYGPFVVTLRSAIEDLTPIRITAGWRVLPDFDGLTVAEVDVLRSEVAVLAADLNQRFLMAMAGDLRGSSDFTVRTGLPGLMTDVDRSLTVTRSSVLALLIQLSILAGYALALTAGLLVDTRRPETALLRSRGAGPGQILASALIEGVFLTVPAAIAAPTLAALGLQLLNSVGPLQTIGLTIDPAPTSASYWVAGLAALLAIITLAWPAYRSARASQGATAYRQRQTSRPASHRIGLDIALVALALVAFWQLATVGPQLSERVRGRFGVDPLLVIAPALGLLAGAILALRIVPLLARIGERIAAVGRGIIPALSSWQVARRPTRYARSSLLLIMAVGIGFFAAAYSTTWIRSQREQASHAVGADISLRPDRAVATSIADLDLIDAHLSVDGVERSMAVDLVTGELAQTGRLARILMVDSAEAGDIITIRDDLGPEFQRLVDRLHSDRPEMSSVALPGEPDMLELMFSAEEIEPEEDSTGGFTATVRVVLQDGRGQLHRVPLGRIEIDAGRQPLTASLVSQVGKFGVARAAYPLSIVNVEIEQLVPSDRNHQIALALHEIAVVEDGTRSAVDAGLSWGNWTVGRSTVIGSDASPSIATAPTTDPDELHMSVETGRGFAVAPVTYSITPTGTDLPDVFPVIVTQSLLDTGLITIGDRFRLTPLRFARNTVEVVGAVELFPGVDRTFEDALMVDLATVQMMGYEPGHGLGQVDEYWLATDPLAPDPAAHLRNPPIRSQTVLSTSEMTDTLVSDPVALGTIGALAIGFVAASVFAAVGFAVSATVSARERLFEFGLLRALGLSPRQLGIWLILEQSVLVLTSLLMGTLVGVVLTSSILPLISVTQSGEPAMPAVIVTYPWQTIVGLELAVVAVLAAIVIVMSVLLRRVGLGSLLRLGED